MKTSSAAAIAAEESDTRKPVELYKIWNDTETLWTYTNGDVAVAYDSDTYSPVTLQRSLVKYNSQLEVTTMTITASSVAEPAVNYVAINPVELLWISVIKLYRDVALIEANADVVFIGQIKNVSFKGVSASIECVGFEHFLQKTIPTWRYQLTCNHQVFDDFCTLVKADYKTTETITLDATKLILTGAAFGDEDDGYFIGGEVVFGQESRAIVEHVDTEITIMYKFVDLASTDSVDVYPGCDGQIETCRDKFASTNKNNFLGMPFIPLENPAIRAQW